MSASIGVAKDNVTSLVVQVFTGLPPPETEDLQEVYGSAVTTAPKGRARAGVMVLVVYTRAAKGSLDLALDGTPPPGA